MVEQHIHRVFVDHGDGIPAGVLSVRDLMQAVVDKRVATPVSEIMVSPVMSIDVSTPLSAATDALATGAMTGIIVTDGKWPAGVFTQEDAILARAHAPETPVERVMSNELVVLPPQTPVYRAAGQSIAMHVRRVVVLHDHGPAGIFTGLDIARVVATA
jgi:predicted transcriptional regulator